MTNVQINSPDYINRSREEAGNTCAQHMKLTAGEPAGGPSLAALRGMCYKTESHCIPQPGSHWRFRINKPQSVTAKAKTIDTFKTWLNKYFNDIDHQLICLFKDDSLTGQDRSESGQRSSLTGQVWRVDGRHLRGTTYHEVATPGQWWSI